MKLNSKDFKNGGVAIYGYSNDDKASEVYFILDQSSYCIALYRALSDKIKPGIEFDPVAQRFWINHLNNSIMMAAVNWCKVFGSANNNKTHYTVLGDCDLFLEELKKKGIDIESYSKSMREFRDKHIAHNDNYKSPVPDFNIAFEIIVLYDDLVLVNTCLYEPAGLTRLRDSYENYCETIKEYLEEIDLE